MDFIKNSQNVILAGNPGTGKTHLAIGLGIKACLEGYKVLFTTVPLLVNQLKESRSNRVLMSFENKFEKYDLIIISYSLESSMGDVTCVHKICSSDIISGTYLTKSSVLVSLVHRCSGLVMILSLSKL